MSLQPGSNVVFRRGPGTHFNSQATVLKRLRRGAWLLRTSSGRKVAANKAHIRQGQVTDDMLTDVYDRERQLDERNVPASSHQQHQHSHRYNLRPRPGRTDSY